MRIAFTGTASTGKTTLIKELFKCEEFKEYNLEFLTIDARSILDSLGFKQMDLMTKEQTKHFQKMYLEKKIKTEFNKSNIISDRSYIDVASYFLVRDCNNVFSLAKEIIDLAYKQSKKYDLHFYFPYGLIPFEDDGYRSRNEYQRKQIGEKMLHLLDEWKLKYIPLNTDKLDQRVSIVVNNLRILSDKK